MLVESTRITVLNQRPCRPQEAWVLYWMQQSQRADDNPALAHAIDRANDLGLPVIAIFALTDSYPEANARHYRFMLEGLAETQRILAGRGIDLIVQQGSPEQVVPPLADHAAMLVCDVGYTRHQRAWRQAIARDADCRVVAVEGDVVLPVSVVSGKAEYAARTIRPKIQRHLQRYPVAAPPILPRTPSPDAGLGGLDLNNIDTLMGKLAIDRSVPEVSGCFKGGPQEARRRLTLFITDRLEGYSRNRNQPQLEATSTLSPYLHFGQISPVTIALQVQAAAAGSAEDRAAFLEELIMRRELAVNYVYYNPDYDSYAGLPAWARRTLAEHAADRRSPLYDRADLVAARTHDPYWNAAMVEMRDTGFMHNHMRMYWGKKILEWSASPEVAFETTLWLNNRYFLDGRDPNTYAGVGWIFGLHDRAWFERPIFGKVRYMAASGLERKCDIRAYVDKVAQTDCTGTGK